MRLLADENLPGRVVVSLRKEGHDVKWIRESHPGMADHRILALARTERRLLLTFDNDFGMLAFHARLQQPDGVLLFKPGTQSSGALARWIGSVLASRNDWSGHFSVIATGRVRMVPLPNFRSNE